MTQYGLIRVSSEEQKKIGLSILAQKEILLKNGVLEKNIYIDKAKSGGLKEEDINFILKPEQFKIYINFNKRPALKKLLELSQEEDEILFTKWDRLSRNILTMEVLMFYAEKKGIKLIAINDTNEKRMVRFITLFSQMELEATTTRNSDIQEYLYDKGIHPYKAPYGYFKNTKQQNGELLRTDLPEGALVINPEEAYIIREAFKTAITCNRTNNRSLYKNFCKKHNLDHHTYYAIIKNRTYTGSIKFKNEWKPTPNVPMIIKTTTYEEAQIKK